MCYYIYDKGLIPRIYEEFFKLNNKTYNEKKKWLLPGWARNVQSEPWIVYAINMSKD